MSRKELAEIAVKLCNHTLLAKEQSELPDLSAKDWNKMLCFTSMQGVLTAIAPLFADVEVNDTQTRLTLVNWFAASLKNNKQYMLRVSNMRELAKLLADEGIDIMFMKGASLAQLYPIPEWRAFSDIDYYLFGKSRQGIEVMKKHGIENSAYYHHHTQASLHGVLLENHYDFVERVNHDCDIILDDALKELAETEGRKYKATFLGDDINNAYIMTPTMNAIFLMRHMSAHFVGETIPLRQLYDWALFLQKQAKDVDWKLVEKLYEQAGMSAFAGIVQQMLRTHLDFYCKACPIGLGSKELAEKVWNSIIFPPKRDPYKKFSMKYYLFEAKTFYNNRWKHKIVYPNESYTLLFFKYSWLGVKKMTGKLKMENR